MRSAVAARSIALLALVVLVGPMAALAGARAPRDLRFEERVVAQEAIERVYYSHQIGARLPFDVAVPRSVLERKVRTYLKQSVALEEFWKTPVTVAAVDREIERMMRQTRMPERLRELYAALGDDALMIRECLARPTLVDRLARSFFAYDGRIHAADRRVAEALRADLEAGRLDPLMEHPRRSFIHLVRAESEPVPDDTRTRAWASSRREVAPEDFERWSIALPQGVGEIGRLVEEREAFQVDVLISRGPNELRAANYVVYKRTWDDWWKDVSPRFSEMSSKCRVSEIGPLRAWPDGAAQGTSESSLSGCVPVKWDNGSLGDLPEARKWHTAIWTGTQLVVWGGIGPAGALGTGGIYDPVLDSWNATSKLEAPSPRWSHTAVWTGSRMLVWGGSGQDTGGSYDPLGDQWTPITTVGAPSARSNHTAVWTGSEMVVWGGTQGSNLNTGSRYDPDTDSWTATSTTSAPSARSLHSAVWTGNRMVVWGGNAPSKQNTGGRYDPTTDSWTATSTVNAPTARYSHTAVWTGDRMIVWGGSGSSSDSGGKYDPVDDLWIPTSLVGAPASRNGHAATWTGTRMIIWGGFIGIGSFPQNTGASYDPAADAWTSTTTVGAPSARSSHTAAWTGDRVIVWGGTASSGFFDTGGRYDPATDSWTPTSTLSMPSPRLSHRAVWTGTHMVVWGGVGTAGALGTGGAYDTATDSWTATSTVNAPSPRAFHTAVWTGNHVVVWGGGASGAGDFNTGGRYDPLADSWSPTSVLGAPLAREGHTAVWTGQEMIVWGGVWWNGIDDPSLDTGGRYDPATDAWTPTSTADAPSPRWSHTAVWTGSRMIVWGGFGTLHGASYDPASDHWTPTSAVNAPEARSGHTAVWTGNRMIIWGGVAGNNPAHSVNTGGLYDAGSDSWTLTAMLDAPSPRSLHTATWTNEEMVVWGGYDISTTPRFNTGGRYDPQTDKWAITSTMNAPSARDQHTAVWSDDQMIVWGGANNGMILRSGGRYVLGKPIDSDGDGVTECAGDCNDADPEVFAPPSEIRNLRWKSHTLLAWDSAASDSGSDTAYDILYKNLAPFSSPGGGASQCLANNTSVPEILDPSPAPASGKGWIFLVRGDNTCGAGRWTSAPSKAELPPASVCP